MMAPNYASGGFIANTVTTATGSAPIYWFNKNNGTVSNIGNVTSINITPITTSGTVSNVSVDWGVVDYAPLVLSRGQTYDMPDGSKVEIDKLGNYKIRDAQNKITYMAATKREFNPYLNASDLLERFIDYVGQQGLAVQSDMLGLPIGAFINWLILEAARKDGDPLEGLPPVEAALPALPAPPKRMLPRCGTCGRFLKLAWARTNIFFCSPEHMERKVLSLV